MLSRATASTLTSPLALGWCQMLMHGSWISSCTVCSQQWWRICCQANSVRLSPDCCTLDQEIQPSGTSQAGLLQILSDISWTQTVTARKIYYQICLLSLCAELSVCQGISSLVSCEWSHDFWAPNFPIDIFQICEYSLNEGDVVTWNIFV